MRSWALAFMGLTRLTKRQDRWRTGWLSIRLAVYTRYFMSTNWRGLCPHNSNHRSFLPSSLRMACYRPNQTSYWISTPPPLVPLKFWWNGTTSQIVRTPGNFSVPWSCSSRIPTLRTRWFSSAWGKGVVFRNQRFAQVYARRNRLERGLGQDIGPIVANSE